MKGFEIELEVRVVERPSVITRTDLAWVAFVVAGVVLVFAVAVLVGMALSELSFIWGPVFALLLVLLVAALLMPELRRLWARLPR